MPGTNGTCYVFFLEEKLQVREDGLPGLDD